MKLLRFLFSLVFLLFISTGVSAITQKDSVTNSCTDSTSNKVTEHSVVSTLSLFSLISLTEEKVDSTKLSDRRIVQFFDLIQTYL